MKIVEDRVDIRIMTALERLVTATERLADAAEAQQKRLQALDSKRTARADAFLSAHHGNEQHKGCSSDD